MIRSIGLRRSEGRPCNRPVPRRRETKPVVRGGAHRRSLLGEGESRQGPTGTDMLTSAFAESTHARRSAAAAYPGPDAGRLPAVDRGRRGLSGRERKAEARQRTRARPGGRVDCHHAVANVQLCERVDPDDSESLDRHVGNDSPWRKHQSTQRDWDSWLSSYAPALVGTLPGGVGPTGVIWT